MKTLSDLENLFNETFTVVTAMWSMLDDKSDDFGFAITSDLNNSPQTFSRTKLVIWHLNNES